ERMGGKSISKMTRRASFKMKLVLTGHFSSLLLLTASFLYGASYLKAEVGRGRTAKTAVLEPCPGASQGEPGEPWLRTGADK
ncbi:hypothetical protein, partial [Burkholderia glumae]